MHQKALKKHRGDNGRPFSTLIDLWILIVGSVFVIPFLISFETADPLLTPRFVALGVVSLGLFVSMLIIPPRLRAKRSAVFSGEPLFVVMELSLLISLLALTQAVNMGEGFFEWLKGVLYVTFTCGAVWVLHSDLQRISRLIQSIIVAGTVFSLIGWIQWLIPGWLNLPGHFDVYGTMGNKNLYASALFLFIPFFLCGLVLYRGRWRLLSALGLFLSITIIIVTRTRSVWLAILVAALAAAMALAFGRPGTIRPAVIKKIRGPVWRSCHPVPYKRYVVLIPCLVLCGGWVGWIATHAFIPSESHPLLSKASIQDRYFLWLQTTRMVADHPWIGIGPGQWKLRLPEYGAIHRQFVSDGISYESVFTRPHNDFLWVLVETGFPGLTCLLFFFGILLQRCIGLLRRCNAKQTRQLAACMLFGVVGFMVISCFSFPRERIFHNVFLALMSALILAIGDDTETSVVTSFCKDKRWPLILGIAICTACVMVGLSRYRSDRYFNQAMDAMKADHREAAIDLLYRARTGLYTLDPAAVPLAWYEGMLHHRSGRVHLAAKCFVAATRDHPMHWHSLNNAAVCLAAAGNTHAADHYHQRADRLYNVLAVSAP
ncbi:MAG: hypothetical protein CSA23_02650 [Deltaproteobacteria bacterium]|nr:MAG: hypothetical protein CSA23_02650 [Deltaproteobacteria bacterium]